MSAGKGRIKAACALVCACLFTGAAAYAAVQQPTSDFYVNDYADIIDSADEQTMLSSSVALQKSGQGAQIVVLTVTDIGDETVEQYALDVLRGWGIGDKDKNNGVLIFVDMGERTIRIEVGYGLEGRLNDGKCGRILDTYALPAFKQGNYSEGILDTYEAVFSEVCDEYGLDPETVSSGAMDTVDTGSDSDTAAGFIVPGIILLMIFFSIFRRRGGGGGMLWPWIFMGGGRGGFGGGFGGGGFGGGGFRGGGGSGGGGGAGRGF